ncbi:hypothetical protein F5B19DRAFT_455839 [Rostrohypoxylon terebratum]|nr:hypothetical protein F5B19DRAFT_455839 [Rostrohypoxylon terebratum]
MSIPRTKGYVERSRLDRQTELTRLAKAYQEDFGLVLGFSSQAYGNEAHVDYVGGLNTNKIWTGLTGLVKPTRWQVRIDGKKQTAKDNTLPSLRNALIGAVPTGEIRPDFKKDQKDQKENRDFAGILSHVDTKAIASYALQLMHVHRKRQIGYRPAPMRLPTVCSPRFGSAHVFYPIEIYDAQCCETTRWIIKIPTNGTPDVWDKLCAEALRIEALMMSKLSQETTIPVPNLIDFDSSPHNKLHVPFLIMNYVEGQTLDQVWFGRHGENEGTVRARRIKVLQSLARSMLQLGRYQFECGGAPVFDDREDLVGVGPLRELDVQAMVKRWLRNEEVEKEPIYAEIGPFSDTTEMYTALLDKDPCDVEPNIGVDRLLCLLVTFIREPPRPRSVKGEEGDDDDDVKRDFVLTHSDLKMHNIIVSEEGNIEGILGWDSVRIAPKSVGNEALPSWLVRDFNPFVWRWQPGPDFWRNKGWYEDEDEDEDEAEGNRHEDAPWLLRELRDQYASIINAEQLKRGIDREVDLTKQSLMSLSLNTAVRDPRCRAAILRRILEKCSRTSEKFDFDHIIDVFGRGEHLEGYKLKCLERNFRELVDRGYVRGAVVW